MKKAIPIAVLSMLFISGCSNFPQQSSQSSQSGQAQQSAQTQGGPPIAGSTSLGTEVTQTEAIFSGWSAKRAILNKPVFNDQNERIGTIDDIIITPENSISFAIIGAGGFLGVGKHDVAIPVNHIKLQNGEFVLPGATKEKLKAIPAFEYAGRR